MKVILVDWYEHKPTDDNEGYIYGLEEAVEYSPDYIEWFKTEKEREDMIEKEGFEVV